MEKEVNTYIRFIRKFEEDLNSNFNISGNIWEESGKNFPKSGKVKEFKYNFHGTGCRIERNGIICEYDIAPLNNSNIKFSVWKLFNFIETNPELENKNIDDVHSYILNLIENKIVSKLVIDNIDTGVFQIDSSYISNLP